MSSASKYPSASHREVLPDQHTHDVSGLSGVFPTGPAPALFLVGWWWPPPGECLLQMLLVSDEHPDARHASGYPPVLEEVIRAGSGVAVHPVVVGEVLLVRQLAPRAVFAGADLRLQVVRDRPGRPLNVTHGVCKHIHRRLTCRDRSPYGQERDRDDSRCGAPTGEHPSVIPLIPVRASTDDLDALADTVAAAAYPHPLARWIVPDDIERYLVIRSMATIVLEHVLVHGTVWTNRDRSAIAAWHPGHPGPPDLPDDRLADAAGAFRARVVMASQAFYLAYPHDRPHDLLLLHAVRPAEQRNRWSTWLLHHHHRTLDNRGVSGYVVATDEQAASLYTAHGYARQGTIIVPDGGPRLVRLWRAPGQE